MRAALLVSVCVLAAHAGTVKDPYAQYEEKDESYKPAEDAKKPDYEIKRPEGHPMPPPRGMYPPPPPPPYPGHPMPPPPHMHYGPPPPPPEVIVKRIISTYCPNPTLQKCLEESLEIPDKMRSLDYPETISLNQLFIRAMQAKYVIDIGCFTGANSLAAALVLPKDGSVFALDESENWTNKATKYWKEAGVFDKITLLVNDVVKSLQYALDTGKAGFFDFAFIDHDLLNYDQYYELTLKLLRSGGMIAFDNRLRKPTPDKKVNEVLKALNEKLAKDKRVTVYDYNIGDGLTLVFKH